MLRFGGCHHIYMPVSDVLNYTDQMSGFSILIKEEGVG